MPDNSDILVYLMDRLNPETMILEVGDEGGLQINDLCVNKVLGIPRGKKDPPTPKRRTKVPWPSFGDLFVLIQIWM
jgi:hypothetical protein